MNETILDIAAKVYVVAEIGSCHEGDIDKAVALVGAAKKAGADIVKWQSWSDGRRLATRRNAPELAATYRAYQWAPSQLPSIAFHVREAGLLFGCSVYLPEDVWRIAEHVDVLKVSSFECEDREVLTMCTGPVNAGRALLVSLGMGATGDTVREWLLRGLYEDARRRVLALACVSAYPAPLDELCLGRLWRGWSTEPMYHGFSDHSRSDEYLSGALAVAAGARVVERHLRLSDTPEQNPDFGHAMTPLGFAVYVEHIRKAERALGIGATFAAGPWMPCEEPMLKYRVGARQEATCR